MSSLRRFLGRSHRKHPISNTLSPLRSHPPFSPQPAPTPPLLSSSQLPSSDQPSPRAQAFTATIIVTFTSAIGSLAATGSTRNHRHYRSCVHIHRRVSVTHSQHQLSIFLSQSLSHPSSSHRCHNKHKLSPPLSQLHSLPPSSHWSPPQSQHITTTFSFIHIYQNGEASCRYNN